jgi:prenylcysteine oxidase/farnesylcysteine lyase
MIKASNATVYLENAVTALNLPETPGKVDLNSSGISSDSSDYGGSFDEVVLATPLQFSDIRFPTFDPEIDVIPYVQLHVTLFTSPHLLSPAFFNLPSDKAAPKVILTTLPRDEAPRSGPEGVGSPGFFSISLLRPTTNPKTQAQEYAYKIFSNTPPSTVFLSKLLAFDEPEGNSDADFSENDVSWIYRKLWNSYPYEYPRVTFEDIQLAEGLWYTSGMDSFISTMETNALSGKNVARLIVDGWMKEKGIDRYDDGMEEPSLLPETSEM